MTVAVAVESEAELVTEAPVGTARSTRVVSVLPSVSVFIAEEDDAGAPPWSTPRFVTVKDIVSDGPT